MNISQSLMNAVLSKNCAYAIDLQYNQKVERETSETMKRGNYFEWLVLGKSLSDAPQLEKLKSGAKSQAEKDIDDLAEVAKTTLKHLGLNMEDATSQLRIEVQGMSGVIDFVTNDIQDKKRQALYDLKYTETKYDDRWNGWADFERQVDYKRQAKHYIFLWYLVNKEYLPFYFVVFGKSGWCRVIKCVLTQESLDVHVEEVSMVKNLLEQWSKAGYPANPDYEKCADCRVSEHCQYKKIIPDVETVEI